MIDTLVLDLRIPEDLFSDFASDPLSQADEFFFRENNSAWPLSGNLRSFLDGLPKEAVEAAFSDENFVGLYGQDERLARIWFAQELFTAEVCKRRLDELAKSNSADIPLPYTTEALSGLQLDEEEMVRLSDFSFDGSSLSRNGFSFVTCLVNRNFNSTYWLQAAFYEKAVADHVRVRLDPFLWRDSASFPQMLYRMLVYAMPLNWNGIEHIKEAHHGQMRPERSSDTTELTEYCWTPRDDGVHFVCEELPRRDSVRFQASRYLHAIYNPQTREITHLDGALRIYTGAGMSIRLQDHVRNAGKAGIRKKVFRIDSPINRDAFSLIAQAFFIWNDDVARYFRETLPTGT